jgi:hypothetical protein
LVAGLSVAMMSVPAVAGDGLAWHEIRTAASPAHSVSVAMNRAGASAVIWVGDGVIGAVHRSPPGEWKAPEVVATAGEVVGTPRVAIDDTGNVAATWARDPANGGPRLAANYLPVGGAWSTPVRISAPNIAGPFDIAFKPSGELVVTWIADEHRGADLVHVVYVRTRRVDGSWTKPKSVGFGMQSRVVVDSEGTAFVTFLRPNASTGDDLVVSRRRDDGSWTNPRLLSEGTRAASFFDAAADVRGNVIVNWNESPGSSRDESGHRIRSIIHRAGGGWAVPLTLVNGSTSAYVAQVAMGADGTALTAWTVGRDTWARVRTRGGVWRQAEALVHCDGYPRPLVAVDAFGNQMVMCHWGSGSVGERITAAFRPRGGMWGPALPVSDYEKDVVVDDLAMGGNRGVVVAWDMMWPRWTPHVRYRHAGP